MTGPDDRVRLNRRKVLHLLDQLADNLRQRNVQAELFVVGGGAIILAYDSERLTYDVDALFEPKSIVYEEAHRIAEEMKTLDLSGPRILQHATAVSR